MLKAGFALRRKIAVPRPDADHQVGIARDPVRRRRPRHADRSHIEGVIEAQAPLAGMRFPHGNACPIHKVLQGPGRLAIEDPAAGNDHRPLAGPNPLDRLLNSAAIRPVPCDMPDFLLE